MSHLAAEARLTTAVNMRGTNVTERGILNEDSVLVYRDTHGR